jgi:hypothetical protein
MAKYNNLENLIQAAGAGESAIGTTVSQALDCKGYEDAILIVNTETLAAGHVGTVTIEDSADGATGWALVAGCTISIADTDDDSTFYAKLRLNKTGVKQYIRVSLVAATAVGPTAATLIAYNKGGALPVDSARTLSFNV